jgi:2-dehydropantoate 2-reductase
MTSSMRADLGRGNRLELPWLSGAVDRMAKDHNVSTPLNRAVSDILEPFVLGSSHNI